MHHDRCKHIHTRYHFICDCVKKEEIEVDYVRSEEQLADILTKPLGRQKFIELREKIGLKDVTKTPQD